MEDEQSSADISTVLQLNPTLCDGQMKSFQMEIHLDMRKDDQVLPLFKRKMFGFKWPINQSPLSWASVNVAAPRVDEVNLKCKAEIERL